MLCVDVYTKEKYWMKDYGCKVKTNRYGEYCTLRINNKEKRKVLRRLRKKNIRYHIYDSCWERSGNYRSVFLSRTKGPYRCRYCNRRLKTEHMEIDHIIPVAKVKKSFWARRLLKMQGVSNVNDIRNLAPSCTRCNARKKDRMGIWFLRGMLGKYNAYWSALFVIKVVLIIILISIVALYVNTYIIRGGL